MKRKKNKWVVLWLYILTAHSNESSEYDTTISVGNNKVLSDSINTSDINMYQ